MGTPNQKLISTNGVTLTNVQQMQLQMQNKIMTL